jgi:hypothetical protein
MDKDRFIVEPSYSHVVMCVIVLLYHMLMDIMNPRIAVLGFVTHTIVQAALKVSFYLYISLP